MNLILLLSIYPAYLVAHFFIKHDPGPIEPKREIRVAIGFGVLSVILALLLSSLLKNGFGYNIDSVVAKSLIISFPGFGIVLAYAAIEEIVKFIPIALYLLKRPFFNEHTDGIIYFATVGLTFGAIETVMYGFRFAGTFGETTGIFTVLLRFGIGLFFHGALTSIAGYFYAQAHMRKQGEVRTSLIVLGAVSLIHAAYNYFLFVSDHVVQGMFISGAISFIMSALMFWLYYVAGTKDRALGLTNIAPPPPK